MRTAFGAFGDGPTQPPPFPQPPLEQWQPGDPRTSDIPTTEDVGLVYVGGGASAPVGGPSGDLPLDPLKPANAKPASSGGPSLPSWLIPAAIGAAVIGALVFGGRR